MRRPGAAPLSFGDLGAVLRDHGVSRALALLASRYVWGQESWTVVADDQTRLRDARPHPPGFEFRPARFDDIPRMRHFLHRVPASVLRAWCGADYVFFVAVAGRLPVAYRCLSRRAPAVVAGVLPLSARQLFLVDEYAVPELRGHALTRRLAVVMAPALLAQGFREVLELCPTSAQRAPWSEGTVTIGTISRTRRLWRVRVDYRASAAPTLPLTRGAAGLPGEELARKAS